MEKSSPQLEACVSYMYRDAANYKAGGEIALPVRGSLEEAEALSRAMMYSLGSDGTFVPEDLGLTELRSRLYEYSESGGPTEDDLCLHELLGVEIRPVPEDMTIEEQNDTAGVSCPAESFEEFAAAVILQDVWHEYDPVVEDYSGPGWRKPSEALVQECIRDAMAVPEDGPLP